MNRTLQALKVRLSWTRKFPVPGDLGNMKKIFESEKPNPASISLMLLSRISASLHKPPVLLLLNPADNYQQCDKADLDRDKIWPIRPV